MKTTRTATISTNNGPSLRTPSAPRSAVSRACKRCTAPCTPEFSPCAEEVRTLALPSGAPLLPRAPPRLSDPRDILSAPDTAALETSAAPTVGAAGCVLLDPRAPSSPRNTVPGAHAPSVFDDDTAVCEPAGAADPACASERAWPAEDCAAGAGLECAEPACRLPARAPAPAAAAAVWAVGLEAAAARCCREFMTTESGRLMKRNRCW